MKLKTLVKLAKANTGSRIPILKTVHVKDNIATSTDMDVWISAPVSGFSFADGDEDMTYYPHGFEKGVFIKSGLPLTDFHHEFRKKGDARATITLNEKQIDVMAWVLKAASREETRYYLNGIYFDREEIIATDGHRVHAFKFETKWPDKNKGAILPRKAVAMILDLVKELKAKTISIEFQDMSFICKVADVTISGNLVDGTFPEWKKVVPDHPAENVTVFNPAEIKALMPALEILGKISVIKTPSLAIEDGVAKPSHDLSGSNYSWPVCMKFPFKAGFNAKYLMEACGGTMSYGDSTTPFKVTDKRGGIEKLTVLMPLRV